jgi:hypothetical protein
MEEPVRQPRPAASMPQTTNVPRRAGESQFWGGHRPVDELPSAQLLAKDYDNK